MVAKIANITKEDSPIFYRRTYHGEAVLENGSRTPLSQPIEFTLEQDAAGHVSIAARFLDAIDMPLVPALRAVKRQISELYDQGQLR